MENTPAAGDIYKLIPKIMGKIEVIEKKRKNTSQGYMFRGIDDVYEAFHKELSDNGVFFVPTVLEIKREERPTRAGGMLIYTILTIKYTFFASDGSCFTSITMGEAMDAGDKSCNKAMSAALKYALLQIFCIPTDEPKDTENESPELGDKASQSSSTGSTNKLACPKCGKPLKERSGAKGKFLGCTGYNSTPKCNHTESITRAKAVEETPPETTNPEAPADNKTLDKQTHLGDLLDIRFPDKPKNRKAWIEQYGASDIADLVGDELDLAISAATALVELQKQRGAEGNQW